MQCEVLSLGRCNSKFIILVTAKMNVLLLIIDLFFETLPENTLNLYFIYKSKLRLYTFVHCS